MIAVALLPTLAAAALQTPRLNRRGAASLGAFAAASSSIRPAFAQTDEEKYLANPADLSDLTLPKGCAGSKNLFLVFRGAGGPDRETDDLLARVIEQDKLVGLDRTVALMDWRPWFTQEGSRISWQGQDIGRTLGKQLAAEAPKLQSLHVVGTSAGAWPSNSLVSSYVATAGPSRAPVILSLTDPFTARADAFGEPWGEKHYGEDADFAEHYVNTDDIVPSTSSPLPLCYCYDITKCSERKSFPLPGGGPTGDALKDVGMKLLGYHNWPMGYMARHYETKLDGQGKVIIPSHKDKPRGAVVQVV